jgi:hypothetical protein
MLKNESKVVYTKYCTLSTFSTEYNYENVEEYELKLIELNKDIITEIQRKLLELD